MFIRHRRRTSFYLQAILLPNPSAVILSGVLGREGPMQLAGECMGPSLRSRMTGLFQPMFVRHRHRRSNSAIFKQEPITAYAALENILRLHHDEPVQNTLYGGYKQSHP